MNDTSGFYKQENDILLYAPNFVESSDCSLYRELKDEYSYPVSEWYWFDNEDQAYSHFNLEKPKFS